MSSANSRSLFDQTQDQHREAVSSAPVPRNARVPGSPEWCYQTMSLLKQSYRVIHIDQEQFAHYLNELREHRAWEKVPVDNPYGSEEKMLIVELGKRVHEIEAELDTAKQELSAQKNKSVNAKAPDLKSVGKHGKRSDKKNDTTFQDRGTAYAIARLRKDRPGIHARVLAGELTANAGMIEAGFRKKRERKKLTAFDHLHKWWKKASADQRAQFLADVLAQDRAA